VSSNSFLSDITPPSLNAFKDFYPSNETTFVKPDAQATSEVLDHWIFTNAIPEWISYLITFSAGIAILMIVAGGVMIMIHPEQEDFKTKGYNTILWALAGLIISVLAFSIVEIVNMLPFTSENPATDLRINQTNEISNLAGGNLRTEIIPQSIQIILQLMGTLALLIFLYAGVLYVISDGEEDKTTKARNLMTWSFIGITISLLAYLIVEGVVQLNFERG